MTLPSLERVRGDPCRGALVPLDEGGLEGSINSDEEIELALLGAHLRNIYLVKPRRPGCVLAMYSVN